MPNDDSRTTTDTIDSSEAQVTRHQLEELVSAALQRAAEEIEREACDGVVSQVLGPVVDVSFRGELPAIGSLLRVGDRRRGLPLEAVELLGEGVIRSLALGSTDGVSRGTRVYDTQAPISVPAPALGAEDSMTYHEAAVGQLLGESGYDARSINEGLAVVYAELDSSNFTGIGISFGGGLSNVCLAYLAAPLFSFSVPKGGDFIDASVASRSSRAWTWRSCWVRSLQCWCYSSFRSHCWARSHRSRFD